jgi:hypothetical protein
VVIMVVVDSLHHYKKLVKMSLNIVNSTDYA